MWKDVKPELEAFGELCAGEFLDLARRAEREKPEHIPFDPWGRRIDEIRVSPAWTQLQEAAAREGLVEIAYARRHGEYSRLHQFAKLMLFHPSSAFFTCPLAMADGAARVLEVYGTSEKHKEAFSHLTSRDPRTAWTSGQWMTERTGGSDVSGTSTEARVDADGVRLYGTKWFSSATTSAMALSLGRYPDSSQDSRGLSLFMVETYTAPGVLNGIEVLRLKDKLGTWALPTAELQLKGARAHPLGEKNQGVKTVATMLNITRLYNSVCSVGQSDRALQMVRDYSSRRMAFGRKLEDHVLHVTAFADEELKNLAGFLLTMELVRLLGREECGSATPAEQAILRLMTPVCKLFTARSAIEIASQSIEGFGGAGYVEDAGMAVHLRDAQVFPIWEGATNVLSLDMLRVIQKSPALESLNADLKRRMAVITASPFHDGARALSGILDRLSQNLEVWSSLEPEAQEASMRPLAFHLARVYGLVLLVEWAAESTAAEQDKFRPWIERYITHFVGEWTPVSLEACVRAKSIWSGRLDF